MVTSRSIPETCWEQAREALVTYFSQRHGDLFAEDLAHDTLAVIWKRSDFEFESEDQFLRVCYGFARNLSRQAHRLKKKHQTAEVDPGFPTREPTAAGLRGPELRVYTEEICKIGVSQMTAKEWQLVEDLIKGDGSNLAQKFAAGNANAFGVWKYRVRQRLADLTGFPKNIRGKKKV